VGALSRLIAAMRAAVGRNNAREPGGLAPSPPLIDDPADAPHGRAPNEAPPPSLPPRPPPPPPPDRTATSRPPPPPPADGNRVVLLFGDGTTAEGSDDPELAERMDYLAANLWARQPRR
jgi:hypothetical protein